MIDRRPGLLAFRRQPKMGADGLRFGNRAGSSIAALKVRAATGPTPGMPQKRRHISSRPPTCTCAAACTPSTARPSSGACMRSCCRAAGHRRSTQRHRSRNSRAGSGAPTLRGWLGVEVSTPRNGERERRPAGGRGWNRVPVGPSAPGSADRGLHSEERERDHGETGCHTGCYERCYRVRYGNSRSDRGSPGNSTCYRGCYRHCYTCCGSKVAENAGDIGHAVRLRLNQSLR